MVWFIWSKTYHCPKAVHFCVTLFALFVFALSHNLIEVHEHRFPENDRQEPLFNVQLKINEDLGVILEYFPGLDWENDTYTIGYELGLQPDDVETIRDEVIRRALYLEETLSNRYFALIFGYEQALSCAPDQPSEMQELLNSALAHPAGGASMVIVTNGFGLCDIALASAVEQLRWAGWHRLVVIQLKEFMGYSFAVNQAMAHIPDHSIVVLILSNVALKTPPIVDGSGREESSSETFSGVFGGAGRDLFSAYELLAHAFGRWDDLVVELRPPLPAPADADDRRAGSSVGFRAAPGLRCPLGGEEEEGGRGGGGRGGLGGGPPPLVLSRRAWAAVGEWDTRYVYQGGAADWLDRARARGRLEAAPADWGRLFLLPRRPAPPL